MASLVIGWEYLSGCAVATDPGNRERAEWPPHPGRVFMALSAAWFETEPPRNDEERTRWEEEGRALEWLESLGDPELVLPAVDERFERSNATVFVPVNDKAGVSTASLQSTPALTRSRQARMFPRIWVGHHACCMYWPDALLSGNETYFSALDRLCAKVTRIGHSSSLVRMWASDSNSTVRDAGETWVRDDETPEQHCRVFRPGLLRSLPDQTNIRSILTFANLDERIRASKGRQQAQAKADYQAQFGEKWRSSALPPSLLRPRLGISKGYRRQGLGTIRPTIAQSHFDSDVLILAQTKGPRLSLVSTLALTQALRKKIMSECGIQPVPSWVSGHESNGDPLRSNDDGHMGYVALPFVGSDYADGTILGLGLVFPRSIPRPERGSVLGRLLVSMEDSQLTSAEVDLPLGPLGLWTLRKREWSERRVALQPESWTSHPDGARTWASVTPVVLDRFPKSDRARDRAAWSQEVALIVMAACERIGLPRPIAIDLGTSSWHRGSPRATGKRRPLRESGGESSGSTAALGDGFPPFPARGTNAPRPQVHVWLRFAEPVVGPILLGVGRYQGYGFCKPLRENW
ncbi:MAG: type I-U CRISPR-associated protein Cas5/Cas6 [Phycisphaerae bacterium]|nr:type I-U CRISPR-associated protein Cas5/Cas6 [Phycisphaerae bacterium]